MPEIAEAEIVDERRLPALRSTAIAQVDELTVDDVVAQVHKIQHVMKQAMKDGEHFGVIPGTGKPTLLKPGAEKLCLTFRLDPEYHNERHVDGNHLTVFSTCTLHHIPTGNRIASGTANCSTKESKYAYRTANRQCPECGMEAIIKGKAEYGGGWVCFKKKDGCGAKFNDNEPRIINQPIGRVDNPDLPDSWNTVEKMANKRALIAAVLNATAASDIFTQDIGDAEVEIQAGSEPVPAQARGSEPQAQASPPKSADYPPQKEGASSTPSAKSGEGVDPASPGEPAPPTPSSDHLSFLMALPWGDVKGIAREVAMNHHGTAVPLRQSQLEKCSPEVLAEIVQRAQQEIS